MRHAIILVLFYCAMVSWALAQQPAPAPVPAAPSPPPETVAPGPAETPTPDQLAAPTPAQINPPDQPAGPDTLSNPPTAIPDAAGARELPLDSEAFDVRVHRRVAEYGQRHEQRENQMSSYDQVSGGDPGLARFSDPRKVQVELSDELDREQTSAELAADYSEEAHDIQSKAQALEEFIAKRRQTLDALNKPAGPSNRQDLEVALANLAHQPSSPETLAAMREIDQPAVGDRSQRKRPAGPIVAEPSRKLRTRRKNSPSFRPCSRLTRRRRRPSRRMRSPRARIGCASRTSWNTSSSAPRRRIRWSRAAKRWSTVEHLAPSPQVESLLAGPASNTKSDTHLEQMRDCINKSGDVQGCRQASHGE